MANPTHTLLIANAKSAEYIHARSHINMDSRHNIRSTKLTVMFIAYTHTETSMTATDTANTSQYFSTLNKPLYTDTPSTP